jgi:hypothetical protein
MRFLDKINKSKDFIGFLFLASMTNLDVRAIPIFGINDKLRYSRTHYFWHR